MAQTPTKYELAINIKKALGLEMLARWLAARLE
jgi:hypothetical protein